MIFVSGTTYGKSVCAQGSGLETSMLFKCLVPCNEKKNEAHAGLVSLLTLLFLLQK